MISEKRRFLKQSFDIKRKFQVKDINLWRTVKSFSNTATTRQLFIWCNQTKKLYIQEIKKFHRHKSSKKMKIGQELPVTGQIIIEKKEMSWEKTLAPSTLQSAPSTFQTFPSHWGSPAQCRMLTFKLPIPANKPGLSHRVDYRATRVDEQKTI